jgi:hypothetical protein
LDLENDLCGKISIQDMINEEIEELEKAAKVRIQ